MKKLTVLALGLAFIGVLSLSSCSKECTCTTKINDEVKGTTVIDREDGKKCKDYNASVTLAGMTTSYTCK